jgi:hypothetical protein
LACLERHLSFFKIHVINFLIFHVVLDIIPELFLLVIQNLYIFSDLRQLLLKIHPLRHLFTKLVRDFSHGLIKDRPYALSTYLTLHEIGNNGRVVPSVGLLGVGGFGADLLVGVTESTTNGLRVTDLVTGVEEVLTLEDIIGGKLTKILLRGNLAGEERRSESHTTLHSTTNVKVNVSARKISGGVVIVGVGDISACNTVSSLHNGL